MQKIFWALLAALPWQSLAQLSENFSDSDFTNNPTWSPDNPGNWTVISGQLRSNSATASSTLYITTPSTLALGAEWSFFVNLQFNTSSANFVDVYLTSAEANLSSGTNNGYFVRIGGTNDEVCLYRMSGGLSTLLIDGVNGSTNVSSSALRVTVTRDGSGNWTLLRDLTGGTTYTTEGTVTDNTFTSSDYFGIRIAQSTSSFHLKHFFDDISIADPSVDNVSPVIESVSPLNDRQLKILFSEELDEASAGNVENYELNHDIGYPISAELSDDGLTVLLTFDQQFPNADTSGVQIQQVEDLSGNSLVTVQKKFFFFESVSALQNDVVFTEIFADPSPSFGLPDAEFVEILNRSAKIFNLADWKFRDGSTEKSLPQKFLRPGQYLILTNSSHASLFSGDGEVLAVGGFPALTNSGEQLMITDETGLLIDSVTYGDDWYGSEETRYGGYSLERINVENFCAEPSQNWRASLHTSGGTPGVANTRLDNAPDVVGPQLISINLSPETELVLTFNERLSNAPLALVDFLSDPELDVSSAIYSGNQKQVILTLASPITSSVVYTLAVEGIRDCSYNLMAEGTQGSFVKSEQAGPRDILISEIFADPLPAIGLPNAEFVELTNRSEKIINLIGMKLSDVNSTCVLPDYLLFPNRYVVVTATGSTNLFAGFEPIAGATNFPTLSNSGESITLRNGDDTLVDSVTYSAAWYRDEDKQAGGWTLELRDLNNTCLGEKNWSASIEVLGGTPGQKNSVYTENGDMEGPLLQSTIVLSETELIIGSNERLTNVCPGVSNFQISPTLVITASEYVDESLSTIKLALDSQVEPGIVYTLSASNIEDCTGNQTLQTNTLSFGLPTDATYHDIIISEIMSDPSPPVNLPEAEYIELHNRTDNWVSLEGWIMTDGTDTTILSGISILPRAYLVLSSPTAPVAMNNVPGFIRVSGFLSLNNFGERIILTDGIGSIIDSVTYSNKWITDVAKRDGGWSLERIDLNDFCSEARINWTVSTSTGGGTPGIENSVQGEISDAEAPALESTELIGLTHIRLEFSEPIVTELTENFLMVPHYPIESVVFENSSRVSIIVQLEEPVPPSTPYNIYASMLADCKGNTQEQMGSIIATEAPEYHDVVITEIMPDPEPSVGLPEVEFIEVYNRSTRYLNLRDFRIEDESTSTPLLDFVLAPGQYAVLSASAIPQVPGSLGIAGFPTLSNGGEEIVLRGPDNAIIDSVRYSPTWHRDDEKRLGGWSLERIDPNDFCSPLTINWTSSFTAKGGTPGMQNSVWGEIADALAPSVVKTAVIDGNHIQLHFDEQIEADPTNKISVDPFREVDTIVFDDPTRTSVSVTLADALKSSVPYHIYVAGLADCKGNSEPLRIPVVLAETPSKGDIIITEIMADPEPSVALPVEEYVEIHNRSGRYLSLVGCELQDATTSALMPEYIMSPGEYLIISATNFFAQFGPNLPVTNFPSLTNSGEDIVIRGPDHLAIDSLHYTSAWYRDDEKQTGGWSLERRQLTDSCVGEDNWTASLADIGGTPGQQNSTFTSQADVLQPQLVRVDLEDALSLTFYMNEKMSDVVYSPTQVEITPSIEVISVGLKDTRTFVVKLDSPLDSGVVYTVGLRDVEDCSGNSIDVDFDTSIVGVAVPSQIGEVIVSEIMSDPSPTVDLPEVEYLELYNRTNAWLDLSGYSVVVATDTVLLQNISVFPNSFVLLTSTPTKISFNGLDNLNQARGFVSLSNTGTTIQILDPAGSVIDSVTYSRNWFSDEKADGGWSLERRDAGNDCVEPYRNWGPSVSTHGGTPGTINSIDEQLTDGKPPKLIAWNIEGATLTLLFDEQIAALPSPSLITGSLGIESVSAANQYRRLFRVDFSTELETSIPYTVAVSGFADCFGNDSIQGVTFVKPELAEPAEVVISEIMADPTPIRGLPDIEYVELVNNSENYLTLSGSRLFVGPTSVTIPDCVLSPGEYIVLTTQAMLLPGVRTLQLPLPTLSNSGTHISLANGSGILVDSVTYSYEWHHDEKAQGGWSLERRQLYKSCLGSSNWGSSETESGGTPGYQNSLYTTKADVKGPTLLSARLHGVETIAIDFDEKLSDDVEFVHVELQSEISVIGVSLYADNTLALALTNPLPEGVLYHLNVTGVKDCSGNLQEAAGHTSIGLPAVATPGDVVINEIMADPTPAVGFPEEEFVEILNRTDRLLDVSQWSLSNEEDTAHFSFDRLFPHEYKVLTKHAVGLLSELGAVEIFGLPSLSNAEAVVRLLDAEYRVVDTVRYKKAWYGDPVKQDGGWSLEKRDPFNACLEPEANWTSSHAISGASPGRQNSVYSTQVDQEPPILISVSIASPQSLMATFNEKLSPNYSVGIVTQPSLSIAHAEVDHTQRAIHISLNDVMTSGVLYSITLNNVGDCSDNVLISASQTVGIPIAADMHDVLINEIMSDPSPAVGLPELEYLELYNRSSKYINLDRWRIVDSRDTATFPAVALSPNQHLVVGASTVSAIGGLALSDFPALNNEGELVALLDASGKIVDSVRYSRVWHDDDKIDGGWSLERKDENQFCLIQENWSSSNAAEGGTPGRINTQRASVEDSSPPELRYARILSPKELELVFDEFMQTVESIELEPEHAIETYQFEDKTRLNVKLHEPLTAGAMYQLEVRATNCSGLAMNPSMGSYAIGLPTVATFKDIVISEIMADPSPVVDLPEIEYLEIHNRSTNLVDLAGWRLCDSGGETFLTPFLLVPGDYLVLCSRSSVQSEHLTSALPLDNFPALTNSGETIRLLNSQGTLIDSVAFTDDWYQDPDKREGGWSMELIDMNNICGESQNWEASVNPSGGSPGLINSVNGTKPDLTGPKLMDVALVDPSQLLIRFNEKLHQRKESFQLEFVPAANVSETSFTDASLSVLRVQLSQPLSENVLYRFSTRVFDCSGNIVQPDFSTVSIALPQPAVGGDVLINELLFNPRPYGADFVEVYNTSDKYVSLNGWQIEVITSSGPGASVTISDDRLLHPGDFLAFTTDVDNVRNEYPQSTGKPFFQLNLPSLPDDAGSIRLLDSFGDLIDEVTYSEDMHSQLLQEKEGVSLERMSPTDWQSGTRSTNFATPGYQNGNSISVVSAVHEVTVEPEIFEPGTGTPNFATLHFRFEKPGFVANAGIFDAQSRLVKVIASNEILTDSGILTWEGDTDEGIQARVGYYTFWLEVFDTSGIVKTFRKRIVISSRH